MTNTINNLTSTSTTLVEQVETNILNYFKKNHLKVGDSIPNEAQLAEELGVARGVLREALSPLKMIGLIESRTRRGMFLREPSFIKGFEVAIDPHFMSESSMFNLLELRMALEIGIFDNNNYSSISELSFHSKLYEITRNNFICDFQRIIHPIMIFVKDRFQEDIEPINIELKEKGEIVTHADLLELLKRNDLEGYKKAIELHFKAYRLFIKRHDTRK